MPDAEDHSARGVLGHSAGAEVVVLVERGAAPPSWLDDLRAAAPGGALHTVDASDPQDPSTPTTGLARIAGASADRPLVLVDGAVRFSEPALPALLDLLDRPGGTTEAAVIAPADPEAPPVGLRGLEAATPARVGADGRLVESVGGGGRRVGDPNRAVVGVLRLAAADRTAASRIWTEAPEPAGDPADHTADPTSDPTGDPTSDPPAGPTVTFDRALCALVRGGLPVAARPYGYYRWQRGAAGQAGAPGSGWPQRLRTASRGGDGLYSAAVVRHWSRRGTAVALRLGWTPNGVTAASLLIGLFAAALVYTGAWWGWVLAALLLQLALVVDCMDGEIARFTRRFSAFGGWLDGVGDRVKEYALFAALAAVAVRDGQPSGWLWASVALVLVTGRHLEDHSYTDKLAAGRASHPDRLGLDIADDRRASAGARSTLPGRPDRRARTVFWAKKVVHLPIAERYLLLSLLLLTRQPLWTLGVAVVANALALVWALGGRVLRELRRRPDPASSLSGLPPAPGSQAPGALEPGALEPGALEPGPLDRQLDLGVPARVLQRVWRWRGPFLPGVVALLLLWLGVIACVCAGFGWPALAGGLVGVPLLAATAQPPVRHRFGWLLPPLLWAAEAAVVAALLAHGRIGAAVFGFLAVVAYRRYDLIYGVRSAGPSTRLDPLLGIGVEGRVLLVAVLVLVGLAGVAGPHPAGTAPSGLVTGLVVGLLLVGLPAVAASVREWRTAGR